MKGLLIMAAVVAVFSLACGEVEQPFLSTASPTATEPPTPPPQTAPPAPTPPADLPDRIQACVAGTPAASDAAIALNACLASDTVLANAAPAEGTADVVLLDVISNPRCFFTESFVLWRSGADWSVQSLEPIIPSPDSGTAFASGSLGWPHSNERAVRARVAGGPPTLQLGLTFLVGGCGSGPQDAFALLALEADQWALKWDSRDSQINNLAHTEVRFRGKGIDGLNVTGDSWTRRDPQQHVFQESNAGPHRLFEQTWGRQGDSFVLQAEVLTPAPYATLVEFVYRLSTGDLSGAGALVTDPPIVESAVAQGLAQDPPGQEWMADCGDGGPLSLPPCVIQVTRVDEQNVRVTDHSVRIALVQKGADWLISGIEACTYRYDPQSGGHCD